MRYKDAIQDRMIPDRCHVEESAATTGVAVFSGSGTGTTVVSWTTFAFFFFLSIAKAPLVCGGSNWTETKLTNYYSTLDIVN